MEKVKIRDVVVVGLTAIGKFFSAWLVMILFLGLTPLILNFIFISININKFEYICDLFISKTYKAFYDVVRYFNFYFHNFNLF